MRAELEQALGRGSWVFAPPFEWGYCARTGTAKPPRAHYCSVRRRLVLNMDHYCIWVFNTIGYANYRSRHVPSWLSLAPPEHPWLRPRPRPRMGAGGRYFVLFLLYFLLSAAFALACCLGPYRAVWPAPALPVRHTAELRPARLVGRAGRRRQLLCSLSV
jgi:hypothetical protein